MRATYLSFKSSVFPIKRRLAEPLRRSNMLNLVPLRTSDIFLAVFSVADNWIRPLLSNSDFEQNASLSREYYGIDWNYVP